MSLRDRGVKVFDYMSVALAKGEAGLVYSQLFDDTLEAKQ